MSIPRWRYVLAISAVPRKVLGDSKKAIILQEQSLTHFNKALPYEHFRNARCLYRLGEAWQDLKEGKKAIESFEESLRIYKKVYLTENPEVALMMSHLGSAYCDNGEAKKGLGLIEEALRIHKKLYRKDFLQ